MACNFKYRFENEGFLKVAASHVDCLSATATFIFIIWETVPDKVITTDH